MTDHKKILFLVMGPDEWGRWHAMTHVEGQEIWLAPQPSREAADEGVRAWHEANDQVAAFQAEYGREYPAR